MRKALRSRHYSRRTGQTYCSWIRRFILFHNVHHPAGMGEPEINAFLSHLAVRNESLRAPLQGHLKRVKARHRGDLAEGWGRVQLPDALDRKYPNAPIEWRWQWVFPQERRWRNLKTGEQGRHHVDESLLQKAVKEAVARAGST